MYQPPNPLTAKIRGGVFLEEFKLSLYNQANEPVPMDEHWSGCLVISQ